MGGQSVESVYETSWVGVTSTSECGDRLAHEAGPAWRPGHAQGNVIRVSPAQTRQTILGIGTSFTESSAFVLAHLDPGKRVEVMRRLFSEQGANFSIARTPIGSCDFCVEGRYCYAAVPGDMGLRHFDIGVDHDGFNRDRYPGIKDERFDLLPMIKQALEIKAGQADADLRIIASAWTAPPWMKDIGDWYQGPEPLNDFKGTGGTLAPGYESAYADYLLRYLDAYKQKGVNIWGLTPVNEPLGNNGKWESMHFDPRTQLTFIREHLGPRLRSDQDGSVKLLMYDHARDRLEEWADVIYADPACAKYVDGAAVHWYESTYKVFEDVFDRVHKRYPHKTIIHTEGCIDDLGNDAPEGISDPVGFKERDWFDNDGFWWNDNATDWAYSATWEGVDPNDHPRYTPVHRYARNIIVSLNHWLSGWIDWNCVLDRRGGPNHVGNYCGAPIMIDTHEGAVYYTPVYYILSQLSRSIRPGDKAVQTDASLREPAVDCLYTSASVSCDGLLSVQVLNTGTSAVDYALQVDDRYLALSSKANSLQTVQCRVAAT
jgi:glucosylceramidase